ncbi:MAG: Dna2/Cas4 domain-containing protein [Lachnospira eligens]
MKKGKAESIEEGTEYGRVKYYLYYLKKRNVDGLHGVIDYPLLKKNVDVELSDEDCKKLRRYCRRNPIV